jgi:polyvinyl alcohol dehydrogenase (cytochrome)
MRHCFSIATFFVLALAAAPTFAQAPAGTCTSTQAPLDLSRGAAWNGWSPGLANTRFQTAQNGGLAADQVPKLKLKWAFGFPNIGSAWGAPTVAGGRLFVGSQSGHVYSLDATSGCIVWTLQVKGAVRSGITIAPRTGAGATSYAAYFGDSTATAHAVDAATGQVIWSRKVEEHALAQVTGTPVLYQGRLYVPVASREEGVGRNAKYECCTFRGSVVALNAQDGTLAWKSYTIDQEARPIGKNAAGVTRFGPSGAGVWSAPTIDAKRRLLYVATGNMYTEPQQPTSDAVLAFDLATGNRAWAAQTTAKDVFVVGCGAPLTQGAGAAPTPPGAPPAQAGAALPQQPAAPATGVNCPDPRELGPDFDFGGSPMLATLANGRELLVIGQKSGVGWAFDPDKKGAVVWQYTAGKGSALGGMEWGSAVDGERAYFPVSDILLPEPGGLHAVRLDNGQRAWYAAPPAPKCGTGRGCNGALSAAITVTPGVVFAGSNDGAVRAYSTKDGSVVWEFDTNRDFQTVNGVTAKGGSINGPGPIVAGGMVYLNSGYGMFGGRPGNVLLAFGVD